LDPDIVHVHTEFNMSRLTMNAARKLDVPLVMSCHTYFEQYINHYLPWVPHGFGRWYARKLTKSHFNKADVIVTPTEPMRQVLMSYGVEKEIAIVPTGIDPEGLIGADRSREKEHSSLFERWPELKGKRVLLFLGRIGKEKNLSLMPRVLSLVRKEVPGAHLLMVGDGPFRDELWSMFASNGQKDHVTFTGYLEGTIKRSAFTLADVFVFPSVTETQGLVTAEAMMCGTPVVAVGEMGTKDVMGGDNGGFMVTNDPKDLARRTIELLSDGDLWRRKSLEACARAELFSTEASAKRIITLYERILGSA
jgi:glycosyltransferase involved in cell wall biosynthesis